MMFTYNHDLSGWGWFGMAIGMIAFWGLLIALVVFAVRAFTGGGTAGQNTGQTGVDPRQILAERFARGEIDEDEYQRRLAALTGAGTPHHPVSS